jgi:hypothetical protein
MLGDRIPPLLGVGELGVDIEDHASERIDPVAHNLSDPKLRVACLHLSLRRRLRDNQASTPQQES